MALKSDLKKTPVLKPRRMLLNFLRLLFLSQEKNSAVRAFISVVFMKPLKNQHVIVFVHL